MMKRSADGSTKTASLFTEEKTKGHWDFNETNDLWIYTTEGCEGREKVIAFDMDGTLITTRSGKVFPIDTNDWKLLYDHIPKKIKEYYNNCYKIVIFSNQKGLQQNKVDKNGFKLKVQRIVSKIGIPMQVFLSIGDGVFRKPSIGMWSALQERNDDVKLNKEESIYVGDAAGRHKTKNRPKKDHSAADRYFAYNLGITFKTPEQFFLGNKIEEPWGPPTFEPKKLFEPNRTHLIPDTKIPLEETEIMVMCGFPGSGKSTFAKKVAEDNGYAIVSRDELGTWQKCIAAAKNHLKDGKSVVVDNTNPDIESRKRYIELAKEMKVKCRCFEINCHLDQARHNIKYRSLTAKRQNEVNIMVLRMFQKNFVPPSRQEGFDEVVKVNPMPIFETEDLKNLYKQYLVD